MKKLNLATLLGSGLDITLSDAKDEVSIRLREPPETAKAQVAGEFVHFFPDRSAAHKAVLARLEAQ